MKSFDVPDAPWIGHCQEEWEEMCNPYSDWEDKADYEEEEADRREDEDDRRAD